METGYLDGRGSVGSWLDNFGLLEAFRGTVSPTRDRGKVLPTKGFGGMGPPIKLV